jgi:hypothetical protein
MVFCHGHLTANDIFRIQNSSFVLLSNLFWSFRPQWYDLAFNVWGCLLHIRDVHYSFDELLSYVDQWRKTYRMIPAVQEDEDFDRKMTMLILERTLGAILVDLGANDFYEQKENQPYFQHLLNLHQQLFDTLAHSLA